MMPEIKNLMPANCNGVWYSNPIFTPTNAVDHNMHARMALNVVLFKKLSII